MPDHTTGKWQVQDSNSNVSLQNTHCTPVKYVVLIVMLSFFLKLAACEHLTEAYKIYFPSQGSNLGPLHWEHGVLATGPPEKFNKKSSLAASESWDFLISSCGLPFPSNGIIPIKLCIKFTLLETCAKKWASVFLWDARPSKPVSTFISLVLRKGILWIMIV